MNSEFSFVRDTALATGRTLRRMRRCGLPQSAGVAASAVGAGRREF
ncbi:MAG: hypothetical protein ACR2LZ_05710 [Pyrinomonadaceae bacterium]